MPEKLRYVFDFPVRNTRIETYLLAPELTRRLGLKGAKLVAVEGMTKPEAGMLLLYKTEGKFYIDRLTYDKPTDLFVMERSEGDFVFLTEEVTVLGTPVGYRSPVNAGERIMKFRKLPG